MENTTNRPTAARLGKLNLRPRCEKHQTNATFITDVRCPFCRMIAWMRDR